ncbi:Laminin subunit gamma-1, partial [Blattella germanica]
CNCNGFSNRCFFDKDLYDRTGHGGHCLDCTGNRDGPNCERCRSRSLQCNSEGKCQCKPGVTGEKCDRCDANHYDFSAQGCKPCGCNAAGSLENKPRCDPYTGVCQCKENVEGKRCGGCKPGYFNLDEENEFGCTPCFCYSHSSVCRSAPGYSKVEIESMFARGADRWSGQDYRGNSLAIQYNGITQAIGASAPGRDPVYFVAPDKFLGDQRASYNQDLSFKLRIGEHGPSPTVEDVVLEGAGLSITQAIFGQQNPLPAIATQDYKFRLHEHPHYGWQPRLSARDFMSVGFLDKVILSTARRGAAGRPANWIEMCTCPDGYVGQFCESCAPGFRHEPANGGPFAPCVPCNCNGHADICDAETGRCICQHNTAGDNCERCARGFYGNALQGTAFDCKHCPCPSQGACTQLVDETIVCLECPKGYGGPRCDLCSDGYYGDPTSRFGPYRACQPCECNENVDPNAVGNCNRTTGECLKCIYNTAGRECDQCMPGFYGDALAIPKGDCKQCQCYHAGTQETGFGPPVCDQLTGQCHCKPHVVGKNCDRCEDGYYNIISGEGCHPCNCDPVGSLNHTCDLYTGQCQCRPGVTGQRCDVCMPYQYGFSLTGCKQCDCDQIGSCYENVEGRQCDRCKENKYDRQRGCIDCPACYNLVQSAVNAHRAKLEQLQSVLRDIANNPTVISDEDFEKKLKDVQAIVDRLWNEAKHGAGTEDKSLLERLDELRTRFEAVGEMIDQANRSPEKGAFSTEQGRGNVTLAEETIEKAFESLKDTMDYVLTDGSAALIKAMERSEQFGQTSTQMSEIAREARMLALQQEKEADDIQLVAAKAANTSSQALDIVKNAITQQQNITDELRGLSQDIENLKEKLEVTGELAKEASQTVGDVHTNALKIYTDIYGLNIPEINIPKLKEARRIKQDAEDLLSDNEGLLEDLRDQIEETKDLLERGHKQQQEVDELLAETDIAFAKADDAVKRGDEILDTARKTYHTLQDFDRQVQESKDKAYEALNLIPEIRQLIADAENKTNDAHHALAGAEQNAQLAHNIAQDAQQKYAEQASQEADIIKQGADQTKTEAERIRDEAEALEGRVAVTASKINELEVGQAKSKSANATRQVEKALQDVEDIIEELNQVPHMDPTLLDELELRLQQAEDDFRSANLDGRIQELIDARIVQQQWVKSYQDEIDRLQADVQNMEDISEALPEGCWKRVQLEP